MDSGKTGSLFADQVLRSKDIGYSEYCVDGGQSGMPETEWKTLESVSSLANGVTSGDTGCKRLDSEGILNQVKTQGKRARR